MKKTLILIAVAAILLTGWSCSWFKKATVMPGSDRDEHGCIGSAGYSWCEVKQKCIRPWEEACNTATPTATSTIIGGDKDEHGCIGSAGYTWCEKKLKCLRIWEESCE